MHRLRPPILATLLALPLPAAAADPASADSGEWLLCPPQPALPGTNVEAPEAPGVTRATSDTMETRGAITTLKGNVAVRRGNRALGAERVRLDRERRTAEASGNVFLREDDLVIEGRRGTMNMDSGAFSLDRADYRAVDLHAQGSARRIDRDEAAVSRLERATYSTCPRDDEDWQLKADSIELDPNTRQGTAINALLRFKGMPILYTPWFRFPIGDERMSGLLIPSFGSSSGSGFTVGVPYYWNAAPNFDATLEPRYLSDRGGQLRSEWRWLGPAGYWRLNNEYLPDDDRFGDDRVLTRIEHNGRFGDGWRTHIDAEHVSDDAYFEDLSSNLSLSSQSQLRQRADLRWSGAPGSLLARYETYQTLGDSSRPYERRPQIRFDGAQRYGGFETRYETELVDFQRQASDTGTRLNARPSIGYPVETPGWFLRPRLGWDYTAYDLDRETTTGASNPDRSLPFASLDSGLIFERIGASYRQTLEPRAFYVYTPEESQEELPVFDTGEYDFSFAQLFSERRFTGPDRMADANRLTLALTTRLLDRDQGREVLRASIGGIHHFDDRTVQLPNQPVETRTSSDLAAEIAVQPTETWRSGLDLRWNPELDTVTEGSFDTRFDGGGNRIVNFGYRYTRERKEAVDFAFAWPLSRRWLAVGSTRYSLREERNFETLLGAEYESCCYRVRALARRYASGEGQQNGFVIELVLKGLGGFGDDAGSLLDRAILGYSR
ncbi:MAG: LPS assembly protein LptD [Halofilum sp. (in: g-proteobacteria)]